MGYLTVEQAAVRVGKTPWTIREWVRLGVLPVAATLRKGGRPVKYFEEVAVLEADRSRRPGRPPVSGSDLRGATSAGEPGTWPANAGEFAARWNAASAERREEMVRIMMMNAEVATRCLIADHAGRLEDLAGVAS